MLGAMTARTGAFGLAPGDRPRPRLCKPAVRRLAFPILLIPSFPHGRGSLPGVPRTGKNNLHPRFFFSTLAHGRGVCWEESMVIPTESDSPKKSQTYGTTGRRIAKHLSRPLSTDRPRGSPSLYSWKPLMRSITILMNSDRMDRLAPGSRPLNLVTPLVYEIQTRTGGGPGDSSTDYF